MTRRVFKLMDETSARFYVRVINTALLNIYAVQRGFFDTLICETEDPRVLVRWREAVPEIVGALRRSQLLDD